MEIIELEEQIETQSKTIKDLRSLCGLLTYHLGKYEDTERFDHIYQQILENDAAERSNQLTDPTSLS